MFSGITYNKSHKGHFPDKPFIENPDRTSKVIDFLTSCNMLNKFKLYDEMRASDDDILRGHTKEHLKFISSTSSLPVNNDIGEFYKTPHSAEAIRTSLGSLLNLTEKVVTGEIKNGFALIRPPGHHAHKSHGSGFCFLSNVALTALKYAEKGYRVAIYDFDVHFGDGTKDLVCGKKNIYYISTHRHEKDKSFYPSTGKSMVDDNVLQIGIPKSKFTNDYYKDLFYKQISPRIKAYKPHIILVSAGYDACIDDPLGECGLAPWLYGEITRELRKICPKLVLALEGGYNIKALQHSIYETCKELL